MNMNNTIKNLASDWAYQTPAYTASTRELIRKILANYYETKNIQVKVTIPPLSEKEIQNLEIHGELLFSTESKILSKLQEYNVLHFSMHLMEGQTGNKFDYSSIFSIKIEDFENLKAFYEILSLSPKEVETLIKESVPPFDPIFKFIVKNNIGGTLKDINSNYEIQVNKGEFQYFICKCLFRNKKHECDTATIAFEYEKHNHNKAEGKRSFEQSRHIINKKIKEHYKTSEDLIFYKKDHFWLNANFINSHKIKNIDS